jgi:hypothetical protein
MVGGKELIAFHFQGASFNLQASAQQDQQGNKPQLYKFAQMQLSTFPALESQPDTAEGTFSGESSKCACFIRSESLACLLNGQA